MILSVLKELENLIHLTNSLIKEKRKVKDDDFALVVQSHKELMNNMLVVMLDLKKENEILKQRLEEK